MALINKERWYHAGSRANDFPPRWISEYPSLFYHREFNDELDYFMIMIFDCEGIDELNLEKRARGKILEEIRNKNHKLHLLLYNSQEGFHSIIDPIYRLLQRHDVPPEKTILMTGSYNILADIDVVRATYGMGRIKVEVVREFERNAAISQQIQLDEVEGYLPPKTLEKKEYTKKYINFNRRWRTARPIFVAMLYAEGILDQGYVSLGDNEEGETWDHYWEHSGLDLLCPSAIEIARPYVNDFSKLLPLYVDTTDLKTNRAATEYHTQKLYEDTYFNLVAETYFFQTHGNIHFFSEKIFKAIMFKHPFILMGCPGLLKRLKHIGYKTFSPMINEDYDNINNDGDRLIAILYEAKRLCSLSTPELNEYIDFCKEITEYNYNLLLSRTSFTERLNF